MHFTNRNKNVHHTQLLRNVTHYHFTGECVCVWNGPMPSPEPAENTHLAAAQCWCGHLESRLVQSTDQCQLPTPSVCQPVCLSVYQSDSVSVSQCFNVSANYQPRLFVSLSVCQCISQTVFQSVSVSMSVPTTNPVCLSACLSVCVSVRQCFSQSVSQCFSQCVSMSVFQCVSQSLTLLYSMSLSFYI